MIQRIYRLFNRSYRDHIRDNEVLNSLNIIILSAAVGTVLFSSSGGAAFTGFASALGAGEFAFGLISALPVLASLIQLYASYLIEKTGKLKVIFMIGGIVQRVSWISVAFIPYIFPDYIAQWRIAALISLVTLAAFGGSFVNPTHMTLMAHTVPMPIRGRYITTRQRMTTTVSLLTGFTVAFVLDHVHGFLGYSLVLGVGGVFGLIDILMYWRIKFPAPVRNAEGFSFVKGMKNCFKTKRTRDYMIFFILWSFTINLSSAFFGKYAIDVISLSYTQMIIFGQITANILSLLIVSRWGVFLDRYGCVPLLFISGTVSTLGILVWLPASAGSVLPLFLFNALGGVFWCANEASAMNMQFSHIPEVGRSLTMAFYAVVTSVASAIALILGGAFLEAMKPVMKELELTFLGTPFDHYKLLFSITIILRAFALFVFLPRVWNEKGFANLREAYKKAFDDARSRILYNIARLKVMRRRRRR